MTVDTLQMYKDSVLEILEGSDITLENLDYAFASIVSDMLDEEFIEENELTAETIVSSLQMYKLAYGELVLESE